MDFLRASSLLEGAQEDLQDGLFGEAKQKLAEALASPEDSRAYAQQRAALAKVKQKVVGVPLAFGPSKTKKESAPGNVISFKSIAQPQKVEPEKPAPGGGKKPMKFTFKSILKPKVDESGDDSPESLGAFLHRNFGHKKWDHAKAMKVAAKAHGKPKDFARATADHYVRLSREGEKKQESVKVKSQYFKQKYRDKQQQREGIFDRFIGGGKGAKKPNISDEPRRGPAPIPSRHAGKHSNKPFQPAVVGYR